MTFADETEAEVLELVGSAVITDGDQPDLDIANALWDDNPEIRNHFAHDLTIRYLVRALKAERRKAKPKPEILPLFPDLELPVPRRIVTAEGKRPLLGRSTATEIRTYVKTLNSQHRDRIAGLQAVLEIMEKYIRTNRGITAAEVAQREAGD